MIAEICYQIARRGGRTLIASQANLAVDNALSRLIHNPIIRAVRKGNAGSVGEEGLPFLEDKVIGTWLQNTANDCEKSLKGRLDNVQVFRQLLASSERFTYLLLLQLNQEHLSVPRLTRIWVDGGFCGQQLLHWAMDTFRWILEVVFRASWRSRVCATSQTQRQWSAPRAGCTGAVASMWIMSAYPHTEEAFIHVAMIRLMLCRLA